MKKAMLVFVSVLMLALCLAQPGLAMLQDNLVIHHVKSEVNEDGNSYSVDIVLSALNEQKMPIPGLTPTDFVVTEDSTEVEVDQVEMMKDLPISVIVVMDISGSMQGERLVQAKSAISNFIKSLYRGDKVAVYTFNAEIQQIIPLTADLNQARDTFEQADIFAGGGTCMFDAAYLAAQTASGLPEGRQAVILVSDGWDTNNGEDVCSTQTIQDVISMAGEGTNLTPIYTIGIGGDHDVKSMQAIADATGGVYSHSSADADLPLLFEQLANRLSSEYVVTYTSQGAPGPHRLTVALGNMVQTVEFDLPGLPPVISFAYPASDQMLEAGPQKITLSLSERGIAVDTFTFKINDVAIGAGGKVAQPPYAYDIDFSQYEGEIITLTVLALDKNGLPIVEASTELNFGVEVTPTPVESTASTTPSEPPTDETCPEGSICIGALVLSRTQLIIIVGVLALLIIAVVVIIVIAGKKKKKQDEGQDNGKKVSLFEGATMDGFALPETDMGRLTMLQSDDPSLKGKVFELTQSPTRIGRSVSNEIALPKDSAVSRNHIEIVKENGQVILREVMKTLSDGTKKGPTYGTFINDRKLTGDVVLKTGDEIGLGRRTKFRYEGPAGKEPVGGSEDVTYDGIEAPDMNGMDDATRDA